MIEHLAGVILRKNPSGVVLDCHGVGYGVTMPASSLEAVPDQGQPFSLWIYTKVREDSLQLFGFLSYEERQAFEVLLQISGVGPKVGIAILSTLSLNILYRAVFERNAAALQIVPGIGARSAEKILLELSGKLERLPQMAEREPGVLGASLASIHDVKNDVFSALSHLGFKEKDVQKTVDRVLLDHPKEKDFAVIVKRCLSQIVADRI